MLTIMASSGPFIYLYLKGKADDILLAGQKRYQSILLQASAGMVREHDVNRLLKLIVYIIKRAVKLKFAAAFIENHETKNYELKVIRDGRSEYPAYAFPAGHPLINYIRTHKEPFAFDELPQEVKDSIDFKLGINLVVPSFTEGKLLGFLLLGDKLNKTLYSTDDINVFRTLSNQASLAVENCIFVEEAKRSQEQLFNAEKLALIGGMAAGAAHQFRNRLNQFAMALGEWELDSADVRDQNRDSLNASLAGYFAAEENYFKSLKNNIRKTELIIQGIMTFSNMQREGASFCEFKLGDALADAVRVLKMKHKLSDESDFPLVTELNGGDVIYSDRVRISESIYNALDNAYEAIREKTDYHLSGESRKSFKPEITFRLTHGEKTYLIEIIDNGIGIKDEDKRRIFAPFFTTKPSSKSGSGIGVYFVKRCVEEFLHGKVWFESEYMRGTTFFIELLKRPPA